MLRKTLITLAFLLASTVASAEILLIPDTCADIKSATYSTGGGDKMFVYAKVHCSMVDGSEKMFLAKKVSASGIFGFGRWTMPTVIDIKRVSYLTNEAKWGK